MIAIEGPETHDNAWDHPLIQKGMTAQLASGARASPPAKSRSAGKSAWARRPSMERLGLKRRVVGFLMQRALLLSGSTVSLAGWTKPVAEPEIGVRMARDLARRRDAGRSALAAVKEILPAIELADFDPPPTPDNLDAVLAGNIYQRHVVLCGNTRAGRRPRRARPRA